MSLLSHLLSAVEILLNPGTIVLIVLFLMFGIFLGALPGIGAIVGMTVSLPITLLFDPTTALICLMAIYSGAMYAGVIPAILINTPGTGAAAASTFDGYPMAKQGNATTALAISACASSIGGVISIVLLIFLSILIIDVILLFQSHHYFLIAILGLSLIIIITGENFVKGVVAGSLGLLITTIGLAPVTGEVRFNLGILWLYDGISFIPALLGIFAISEMYRLIKRRGGVAGQNVQLAGSVLDGVKITFKNIRLVFQSSVIGVLIGLVPGAGGAISTFVSYGAAKREDESNTFGNGNPKGLIAAESANNATVGGALIPTIAFGVPGSGATAVLLGGLILHGLRPGPGLFEEQLFVTFSLLISLLITNLFIIILGLTVLTKLSFLTKIDTDLIVPLIVILSILGVFEVRTNWLDLVSLHIFGVMGYFMYKYEYSVIAFVLGIVLGPIAETNLHRSLQISGGSPWIFIKDPLAIILLISLVVVISSTLIDRYGFKPQIEDVND